MPLRLFGGRGSDKVRTCPACEQEVAAEATFCRSCYMVFRPEGAADLREHLQGGRIPSYVYLLRNLQAEDPNAGPVVRVSGEPASPPAAGPSEAAPVSPVEPPVAAPVISRSPVDVPVVPSGPELMAPVPPPELPALAAPELPLVSAASSPSEPIAGVEAPAAPTTQLAPVAPPATQTNGRPRARGRTGVELLVEFAVPQPPPARSVEEIPELFTWMLELDPIIPNNLERLQEIHARVFRDKPARRLEYEPHILLQVADDLALHPNRDALELHLSNLALGYRRAAEAYHAAARRGEQEADGALWQMASMASRLRIEAWVYQTRHGVPAEIAGSGHPRTRRKATGD